MQKRILAIDYGEKRIGMAVTDPTGIIVSPVTTIVAQSHNDALHQVAQVISNLDVGTIVIGLPVLPGGSEGAKAVKVRSFGSEVTKRTGIECVFLDERFTTVSAKHLLLEAETKKKRRTKEKLDSLAATVLLNDYLRQRKR